MVYLVNCRDCGFMRASDTTYDMGNGDLVRDQHESATLNVETVEDGEDQIEKHEVVLQTWFRDEKSEFHNENFEDNFGSSLSRGRAPRAEVNYRSGRVVVVRDEYASGDIRVYPLHHVPEFIKANRYSIIHAPEKYEGPEDHVNVVEPENARKT